MELFCATNELIYRLPAPEEGSLLGPEAGVL